MEGKMFNCAAEINSYHEDEVTLPNDQRDAMRDRRNANRDRLKAGLVKASKPKPREFCSQGSYAMKTMVQHPANAYDVDDGVYFDAEKLVGDRGSEMSALDVRSMIRNAVDDGSFKTKPEVRGKCVRVYYDAGYHVDIPAYRRKTTKNLWTGAEEEYFELAGVDWKRSDARDVTDWFEKENKNQSPDTENGGQLRRITRLLKKFSGSRSSWRGRIAKGFTITKLVTECFKSDSREDMALHGTMKAIRDRLAWNLEVNHPVTPGEKLTSGYDDSKTSFLKDKLDEALETLKVLFKSDCTRAQALKAWDTVFNTDYFSCQGDDAKKARFEGAPAILSTGLLKGRAAAVVGEPVRKDGGGRYA
jgi:hypothetical protein